MAHTTQDAKLVWQQVKAAIDTIGLNKEIQDQMKALKDYTSQVLGNPNLKFTAIDKTTNGSDGSNADTVISDTANTALIALVLKKGTGSVAAFPSISDHASAIQAAKVVIVGQLTASKQVALVYPKGFKNATGMTYASVTAYNGQTHSLTADSSDGFAISIDAERT
jgi:hypothetical protein